MAEEPALWAVLDACGLPFRMSRGHLITRFGRRPSGWHAQIDDCVMDAEAPFLKGLSQGFGFQVAEDDDLLVPAQTFTGYFRANANAEDNQRFAEQQLMGVFGQGRDCSASNTICKSWQFGRAFVRAMAFPPHLNQRFGPNARNTSIPGSATECSVTIFPNWLPSLTAAQEQDLLTYQIFGNTGRLSVYDETPLHRWPAHLGAIRVGYGLSLDGANLVKVAPMGHCIFIPRDWLVAVHHDGLTPAKGGANSEVSVSFLQTGQAHLRHGRLRLSDMGEYCDTYLGKAEGFAELLGLPLKTTLYPND